MCNAGADVKALDEVGEAPIHVACARGVLNIVLALTDKGADINCSSSAGVTPLHKAACFGQAAIVRNLIKQGRVVNFILFLRFILCFSITKHF